MRAFANPDLSSKFVDHYSQDVMKRMNLARNPSSSPELLFELAHSNQSDIRCYVAMNPNTALYLVKRMTADEDPGVRACAFRSRRIHEWICDLYWSNPANERTEPAWNQETSGEALWNLSFSLNLDVRLGVASNSNTPLGTLEMLAGDGHPSVRLQVALNEKTPEHVINMFKRDPNDHVRRIANMDPQDPFAW